jgi:Carotenoid biosynthesis protein
MNKALSNNVIWLLVAGYFLWVLADSFFHPASTAVSATMNVFFLIAIATLHGLRRYSLKEFLIFFVIAFIVSNFYENLSILTGFPFGHYHYTRRHSAPSFFSCRYSLPPRILDAATWPGRSHMFSLASLEKSSAPNKSGVCH